MPDLDIKSDTINKGLEIIEDSTKESRTALDKNTAGGINKFFALLNSTPIAIKIDTYIAEKPYKLEKAMQKMKSKYKQIPEENRVEPSSYIALQTVNNLNYCLDEEHLRNAFINILISDMDSRKKSRVKPAYVEMVKQLNKEDAEFLKLLANNNNSFPSIELLLKTENKAGEKHLKKFIIYDFDELSNGKNSIIGELDPLVIDNLLYLNLIKNSYEVYYPDYLKAYEFLFDSTKNIYHLNNSEQKIDYKKRDGCSYRFRKKLY